MKTREEVVTYVRSFGGIGVTKDRPLYVELLGANESADMQRYFCARDTSGCGLVIRGMWRGLGVTAPFVNPPYRFGTAISALVAEARRRSAWSTTKPGAESVLPQPGDVVLVGGDSKRDGGVEHVFTVLSVSPQADGTIYLTSIDGGQRDAIQNQIIIEKVRRWIPRDGSWWDVSAGSDPGADAKGGRRVMGFADVIKVLEAEAVA